MLGFVELMRRDATGAQTQHFVSVAPFGWALVFKVQLDRHPRWKRAWERWAGLAMPFAIFLKYAPSDRPALFLHETRHIIQWSLLGPIFPLVYLFGGLAAMLGRGEFYKHNPLERDARKYAGQEK